MMAKVHGSPLLAISAMLGATFCYLLGDTLVKLATDIVPVPQIILVRGGLTVALVLLAAAASRTLHSWRRIFGPWVFLRGIFDGAATLLFTSALPHMRIADATAVINAVPVAATFLAVLILKERVSPLRWFAILTGFVGVLLVVGPGTAGFNSYGLLAVGAMLMVSGREIVTRRIPPDVPSLLVTLWSVVAVTIGGFAALLVTRDWVPLEASEFGTLFGAALALFGAYHLSVVSLRNGEVSLVGPFRYMIIVWGLIMGFLIWGDVPNLLSLVGMALIVAGGILVFRGELRRSRTTQAAAAPAD